MSEKLLDEEIDKLVKAGRIAHDAIELGRELIKPGASLLDVSDKIESFIISSGGFPAFPVQISMDNVAAHNAADPDDKTTFNDQLCSLDLGVSIEGYISDTALTIDLSGKNSSLVKASEEALKAAIDTVKPGVEIGKIGRAIHDAITSFGFSPVVNLTGHGLGLYQIHTAPSIPNFDTHDKTRLEEDMVIAIEPFATPGIGRIRETENANIFAFSTKKPVRSIIARRLLHEISSYHGLPFTTRWLTRKFKPFEVNFGLSELLRNRVVEAFPPLVEVSGALVSQREHSMIVREDPLVYTR